MSNHKSQQAVILCVDDELSLLKLRAITLTNVGYRVVVASTADEALQIFNNHHIDLVITDHLLPGRTGLQLASEMKKINPNVPVMMLSGTVEMPDRIDCIDAFVLKGGDIKDFLAKVAKLINAREKRIQA